MEKVIAIVGPTAVGKTALGVAIAQTLGGEIISADSRQVYRGLDIGTGKVTREEREGIPHHLIDVADPKDTFTAADFVKLGRAAIADISARGKVPTIVGGTGFYIDTLLGRMTVAEVPPDEGVRLQLLDASLEDLQKELRERDPKRYSTIDTKNRRRLERAIEITRLLPTVEPLGAEVQPLFEVLWLGLMLPIPELRERIRTRLIKRLEAGMLDEARRLHTGGLSYRRMEELGLEYRYLARHLSGQSTYDEMLSQLEKEIAAYAKRQMTWFKKNKNITWFPPDDFQKCIAYVKKWYGKK